MVVGLFKYALRAVLGILAVVAILALSLNFYLGLSGPQSRLQSKAGKALGTPVLWAKMEGINVLRGASVIDFRIPGEGPEGHPPLLQAPKVEVSYSLSDLLDSRLVLPKLWFYQPVLVFPEDAEGRLILPLHAPKAFAAAPSSAPGQDQAKNTSQQPWPLTLSSFAIVGGRLRILDREGRDAVLIDGLEHGGRISRGEGSPDTVNAFGQFGAVSLRFGKFTSANVQGGYTFAQGVLSLSKLLGTAYHGQWNGRLSLRTDAPGLPCDFDFQATGLELNEILKSADRPDLLSGSLSLTLSGRGPSRELADVAASATFAVKDGQLIRVGFVEDLAAALTPFGLNDLSQPDFTDCHGALALADGKLQLSDFSLAAAAWTMTGSGVVGLDGQLALDCRLHFHPDTLKRFPAPVLAKLTKEENGDAFIPFTLKGRLDRPESDLLARLGVSVPKASPVTAPTVAPASAAP